MGDAERFITYVKEEVIKILARKIKKDGKIYKYKNTPVSAVIRPKLKEAIIDRKINGFQSFTSQINEALLVYLGVKIIEKKP